MIKTETFQISFKMRFKFSALENNLKQSFFSHEWLTQISYLCYSTF